MAKNVQPRRFIPFRKSDVVEMCLTEGRLPDLAGPAFRDFGRLLEALFHFEFHRVLERLGIISIRADKIYGRPLEDAKRRLDKSWDNFFDCGLSQETGRSIGGLR